MKTLLPAVALSAAGLLFAGCLVDQSEYSSRRRGAYYDDEPRYHEGADVVVYRNDGGYDRRRRGYEDREANRTNIHERNVYRTNVHDNGRVSSNRARVTTRGAQVTVQTDRKGKKHHKDDHHDQQAQ